MKHEEALKTGHEIAALLIAGGIMTAVDVRWSLDEGVRVLALVGRTHVGFAVPSFGPQIDPKIIADQMTRTMRRSLEGRGPRR